MCADKKWSRVSRAYPCPICGKPDNCTVSVAGGVVWCGRISDGSLRQNAGGQFLHRLNDAYVPRLPPAIENRPARDFSATARLFARDAAASRADLAEKLGVAVTSLVDLGVGWDAARLGWTFPERDSGGKVIGISVRYRDGSKRRMAGGKAGLTYADGWSIDDGPILLVEGGSDTAALMSIGLNAIGRPSNFGGVRLLIDVLRGQADDREIVVIGERDEKPDGRWPGREGAISTAKQLAEHLERPVAWSLCPDGAKDARDWLRSMPSLPADRLADLFVTGLERTVMGPPITFHPPRNTQPVQPVADWREALLQARLRSFARPGYYVDASPTGAGKTHVDFEALMHMFRGEAA